MAKLILKKVKYKNFLSVGNKPIEIELNKVPMTIIVGSNGSGKTTGVVDAIYFALTGKSIRKTNKPLLVNNINKRELLVELELEVNGKDYKIIRGIAPNRFEIYEDGTLINQDSRVYDYQEHLNKILGISEDTLKQIIFLNSTNYKPFAKCNASERKSIIDDLFGLHVINDYNDAVKQKYIEIKDNIKELAAKKSVYQDQLKKFIEMKGNNDEENDLGNREKIIREIDDKIHATEMEIEEIRVEMLKYQYDDNKILEMQKIEHGLRLKKKEIVRKIELYNKNVCPTCERPFENKADVLRELSNELKKIEEGIVAIGKMIDDEMRKKNELEGLKAKILALETKIKNFEREKEILQREARSKNEMKDKINEQIDNQILEINGKIQDIDNKLDEFHDILKYLEILRTIIRNDILKKYILQKHIPIFEKYVREYLGVMEFPYNIKVDDGLGLEFVAGADSFPYWNLSEGQRLRVDLAIMLALRKIAQIRSSSLCNYIVLDEIGSSSLDENGIILFVDLLKFLARQEGMNIFLITHNEDMLNFVGDARILMFTKGTFTEMKEIDKP